MLVLSATEPAPAIASVVRDVPPILGKIVDRALAFDKAARWQSAQAMRAALLDAGRIVWPSDGPDGVVFEDEEKTTPAAPSQMRLGTDVAPSMPEESTLEFPTLAGAPQIESHAQPERAWRALPFISVAVCGIGVGIAIAAILAVPAPSRRPAPGASEPSATSLQARGGAVTASSPLDRECRRPRDFGRHPFDHFSNRR
jgi:hypothetical protein